MRERLSIARARSDYDTCSLEANADPLGVLAMRWLDNADADAKRQVKWLLARYLAQRFHVSITGANRTVVSIMAWLANQRCQTCRGRGFSRHDASIKPCLACNHTGMVGATPAHWGKQHQNVLRALLASIGRAIAQAKAAAGPA